MKLTKILGLVAVAALALMAFASSASATTLEVKGVKQTGAITIKASLKAGTSLLHTDTVGNFINTCTASTIEGSDSTTTTGAVVSGPISTLSFGTTATPCTDGNPVVHAKGTFSIEWLEGTTNGTVRWHNGKMTTPSGFGTLTCTTPAAGTDIGTLTGVASGNATLDFNAVLNCGITTKLTGTYSITSPEGLGVIA
jgi:hypothetical protein